MQVKTIRNFWISTRFLLKYAEKQLDTAIRFTWREFFEVHFPYRILEQQGFNMHNPCVLFFLLWFYLFYIVARILVAYLLVPSLLLYLLLSLIIHFLDIFYGYCRS